MAYKLWGSLGGRASGGRGETMGEEVGPGRQAQQGQHLTCHPLALSEAPRAPPFPPPSTPHRTPIYFFRSRRPVSPLERAASIGQGWWFLCTGCTCRNRREPCEADPRNLGFRLTQEPSGTRYHSQPRSLLPTAHLGSPALALMNRERGGVGWRWSPA